MANNPVILSAVERGQSQGTEELVPPVCNELRRLAARHWANERPSQTLQATALVHEAYVRRIQMNPQLCCILFERSASMRTIAAPIVLRPAWVAGAGSLVC